jgi:hypothetical protein
MPLRLSVAAAVLTAGIAAADAPSPLDLVRGLRENGMPDLALEYLGEIEKGKPPADVATVLPLERAKVQLLAAQQEPDDAAKETAVAAARASFEKFLKDHAKHPRAGEATVALGRVVSIQAQAQLAKAFRQPAPAQKAAAAATRTTFEQSAKLFAAGAKATAAQLADPNLDPARKVGIAREAQQAELERGINLFKLADTYIDPEGTEATARAKALDDAKAVFDELGKTDPTSPVCWQARAWVGACEVEKQNRSGWEAVFARVRDDAKKTTHPAAADGVRMVEFFELQNKFVTARGTPTKPALNAVRSAAMDWLQRDRYKARPTPERMSVTYYLAHVSMRLGAAEVVYAQEPKAKEPANAKKPPPKIVSVPTVARDYLTAANREYKKLLETDNNYSARAARERTTAIRLLVGDPDQPPAKFADFETCQMAALVHLAAPDAEAGDETEPASEKTRLAKAIALLERCRHLTATAPSPRDVTEAGLQLAYAYLSAGRPQQAAVLGEHLTRTARNASNAAKGGMLAVDGYLASMKALPADAEDSRSADRSHALALAGHLEKTYPTDPMTDAVRFRLGRLFLEEKDHRRAFDALTRVGPGYPALSVARTLEGMAAYALVVPKDSPLAADEKAKLFARAIADMEAVPEPAAGATAADARSYLQLRTLLAQMYLANPPTGYAKAEAVATAAAAKAGAFTNLDANARKAAGFAADEVRLKAVYAQAVPLYRDGKFEELATRLRPSLEEINKGGAANQGLEGDAAVAADNLDKFRREVIVLALQGKIREGAVDQAGELFGVLEKLGGSAEATADALTRLVGLVRPQLDELRKANKTDEAAKLAKDVSSILEAQANKPNLPPRTLAFLGRSLRELASYPQAVAVLGKVPTPPADHLKDPSKLEGKEREAVGVYQVARLELARAHRESGQLDEAGQVLTDALGADGKGGWAKALDFKREAILLTEDRAAAAPQDQKNKLWVEAKTAWERLAGDYRRAAVTPPRDPAARPAWERDREKLIPIFLGLFCDLQRCLARANTQLVADEGKRAERLAGVGKQVADLETSNAKSLTTEVKAQFAALLADFPAVKDGYTKAGGKAFVE